MKNQFFTSLIVPIAIGIVSSSAVAGLFTQAKAQTGCAANWNSYDSTGSCTEYFFNTSTGTNNNTQYSWTFGDGNYSTQQNPSHTYSVSGTYTVCLTIWSSDSTCYSQLCKNVTVQCGSVLSVSCTYTNISCNGNCTGTANSALSGGTAPYTYSWNPTGQTTQTATGLCAGTYTVTVTDAAGGTAWCYGTITQVAALTTAVTSTPATCNQNNGTATATAGGGTPGYTYSWNNGQITQTATGLAAGTYTVTVTDAGGCTHTATVTVTCTTPGSCVANWQSQSGTNSCTVYFTNTSTGTNANTQYFWNFGDGQYSNVQSPSAHTYSASGTYNVCLTIWSSDSNNTCLDTLCKNVTVQCGNTGSCVANWTSYADSGSTCNIHFYNTSTGTNANTQYNWAFGDGTTSYSYLQNPSHTYSVSGTYSVCLTIWDSTGCYNTLCKNVTVQCGATGIASSEQVEISLSVNNPVSSSADIHYFIPTGGNVELVLFDIVGNKTGTLETGNKSAGMYAYTLNTDAFSKGMYFLRLNFEGAIVTKKIIIVR